VIKRIAPDAQVIDITHGIAPTNVLQGSLVLANTLPYMPEGVHLAVVDPGVGGERKPLALRGRDGRLYVGPDNGLLLVAAERLGGVEEAVELAEAVVTACEKPNSFHQLTPDGTPIRQQVEAIATRVYGADGVDYQAQAEKDLARMDQLGFGTMPVCMAKTHLSLTHDPLMLNRPTGWRLPVRGVVPSAGAGFVVVLCGDMQRMPGLGRTPAYMKVDIDENGRTIGLF